MQDLVQLWKRQTTTLDTRIDSLMQRMSFTKIKINLPDIRTVVLQVSLLSLIQLKWLKLCLYSCIDKASNRLLKVDLKHYLLKRNKN